MKIFNMDDVEWWAGESLEAVKAAYLAEHAGVESAELDPNSPEDMEAMIADARELTEEEMDGLVYRTGVFRHGEELLRTFRRELAEKIAAGIEFPCPFASTEG